MDAVPFVISTKGARVKKPVEQYDMLRSLREFLQWREGDSIILAEANVLPETDMEYFGEDGDRMHMMFNFQSIRIYFTRWQPRTAGRWCERSKPRNRGPRQRNGVCFCAITTSWISAA